VPDVPAHSEFVSLARITRPQGRRGEVMAELHTDFPEQFARRKRLWLLDKDGSRRPAQLDAHWLHKGGVVLKFAGVDSISAAEELSGDEVQIPAEERQALGPGAAYISDLVGCRVIDETAGELGVVEDVLFGAGDAPLLKLRRQGKEILLPFAQAYVKALRTDVKELRTALPAGLLEMAAAGEKQKEPQRRKK
jgi:16S rRNA processing protein RimM